MDAPLDSVRYVVGYEAKVRCLNGFADALSASDFGMRYQSLVHNLDAQSVFVVDEIIRRMRLFFAAHEGEVIDLYTEEEKSEFRRQKRDFASKILHISSDLFFWGGCFLPIPNYEVSVFFYRYGIENIQTLASIGDSVIIDAGGYVGDSAWLLSQFTTGSVYVFEPLLENFEHIHKTITYNALTNVKPIHAALGSSNSVMSLSVPSSLGCATLSNKLVDGEVQSREVKILTLDGFVFSNNIRRVGLIKTDVEGAEQMLLAGALETIKRDKPILIISIYHNASDFFDIKPMIENLKLGYKFKIYHPPIRNISGETVLIAEVPRVGKDTKLNCDRQDLATHRDAMSALGEYLKITSLSVNNARKKYQEDVIKYKEKLVAANEAIVNRDKRIEDLNLKVQNLRDQAQKIKERYIISDNKLKTYKDIYKRDVADLKNSFALAQLKLSESEIVIDSISQIIK